MQDKCSYIYLFILSLIRREITLIVASWSIVSQLALVYFIKRRPPVPVAVSPPWSEPDKSEENIFLRIKMIEMLPQPKWQHFVLREILKFHEILQNLSSGKLLLKVIFWNDFIWNLGMELHRRSYNNLNINRSNMINSVGNRKYTIFILYFFNSL